MSVEQRDGLGRFLPGHQLSVGNHGGRPPRAKEEQLLGVLREAVTEEKLIAMVKALVERATAGDVAAAKLLLSYLIGQPAQQVQLDRGRVVLVTEGAGPFADQSGDG